MGESGKAEAAKWRRLIWVVTVPGVVLFSLPWIPSKYKFMLAIPLYAMFVFVFYKYLCVKKEESAGGNNSGKQTFQEGGKVGKEIRVKAPAKRTRKDR